MFFKTVEIKNFAIKFLFLGWFSHFGYFKNENHMIVIDLWKLRIVFGKKRKTVPAKVAIRRFERMLETPTFSD